METVIIVIHLMLVLALVGVVLLQKSEGGALGIGGGGFMSSRGTANVLTRTTAILGAGFFATSLVLAVLAGRTGERPSSILDRAVPAASQPAAPSAPAAPASPAGILDQLQQMQKSGQSAPAPKPAGQ
ncbi:preprotein translocase subunit SecG [Siculibacillus lacustris]|uniref:Protein-export membrane protein SecG n=1 Tax=Siculibacillus lacustris TaxID=1549641 RepID=A0A4Q9VND3_9HYPH|nr:preprotein translocase subunit SecG [Siculibacillus lacustris]TBW37063.1 preprotein translocase subunit SecG [Siculibacillus lacustris]